MTLGEFEAWLDGFLEGKEKPLSNEALGRIRQKLQTEVEAGRTMIDLSAAASTHLGS